MGRVDVPLVGETVFTKITIYQTIIGGRLSGGQSVKAERNAIIIALQKLLLRRTLPLPFLNTEAFGKPIKPTIMYSPKACRKKGGFNC